MFVVLGNSLAPTLRDYFTTRAQGDDRVELLPAEISKFVSTEATADIKSTPEDIAGKPITVIQSLAAVRDHTANDTAMELLLTVRALKRYGAGPVWVVMPFMAYGRQDRQFDGKMNSIAIDDFAQMLKNAGAEGVSTIEMHSEAGVGFLQKHFGNNRVFNLDPTQLIASDIVHRVGQNEVRVGGPDEGANDRAASVASEVGAGAFEFTKTHIGTNDTEVTGFKGNVQGVATATVDDMIDTGGTIIGSQVRLAEEGATHRLVYAAHGLFSNNGLRRLYSAKLPGTEEPLIARIVVTDTIDTTGIMASLISKYGLSGVRDRFQVIGSGEMLYEHMTKDIALIIE